LLAPLLAELLALGVGHIEDDRSLPGIDELDRYSLPFALGDLRAGTAVEL